MALTCQRKLVVYDDQVAQTPVQCADWIHAIQQGEMIYVASMVMRNDQFMRESIKNLVEASRLLRGKNRNKFSVFCDSFSSMLLMDNDVFMATSRDSGIFTVMDFASVGAANNIALGQMKNVLIFCLCGLDEAESWSELMGNDLLPEKLVSMRSGEYFWKNPTSVQHGIMPHQS